MDHIEKFAYEVIGIVETYRAGHLTRGQLFAELKDAVKTEEKNKYKDAKENLIYRLQNIISNIDGELKAQNGYNVTLALEYLVKDLEEN